MRFFCGEATALHAEFEAAKGLILGTMNLARLRSGGLGRLLASNRAAAWQERVSLHAGDLTLQVEAFWDLMIYRQDRIEVIGPERLGRWVPDLVERGFEGGPRLRADPQPPWRMRPAPRSWWRASFGW